MPASSRCCSKASICAVPCDGRGGVACLARRAPHRPLTKQNPRGLKKHVDRLYDLLYHYGNLKSRHAAVSRHALETRRHTLLTTLALPPDGLPGSLALSHR